jgi:hypothetical protein
MFRVLRATARRAGTCISIAEGNEFHLLGESLSSMLKTIGLPVPTASLASLALTSNAAHSLHATTVDEIEWPIPDHAR